MKRGTCFVEHMLMVDVLKHLKNVEEVWKERKSGNYELVLLFGLMNTKKKKKLMSQINRSVNQVMLKETDIGVLITIEA